MKKNERMAAEFSGFDQEKIEERVLKIYNGLDQEAIKSGRYIFPPGLDPIIVHSTPVKITSLEDGRENIVTIGEIIEAVSRQFALSFND